MSGAWSLGTEPSATGTLAATRGAWRSCTAWANMCGVLRTSSAKAAGSRVVAMSLILASMSCLPSTRVILCMVVQTTSTAPQHAPWYAKPLVGPFLGAHKPRGKLGLRDVDVPHPVQSSGPLGSLGPWYLVDNHVRLWNLGSTHYAACGGTKPRSIFLCLFVAPLYCVLCDRTLHTAKQPPTASRAAAGAASSGNHPRQPTYPAYAPSWAATSRRTIEPEPSAPTTRSADQTSWLPPEASVT